MVENPLKSLSAYSRLMIEMLNQPLIEHSTVTVWSVSPYTGIAEGEIFLVADFRLRMREELDFDEGLITAYGYEIYRGAEKLYWYDDYPHPHILSLASTHPHHKHIPPDIKRNRIPAPGITFTQPNLPYLLQELVILIQSNSESG